MENQPKSSSESLSKMMSGTSEAKRLAASLLQKHGMSGAKTTALDETIKAQKARDYYQLSIWREVRQLLETQQEKPS